MFHAVNGVECPLQSAGRSDAGGIGRGAVGIDDLAARQRVDPRAQRRVGGQHRHVYIVHRDQIFVWRHAMHAHQPGQCGAMLAPVERAQAVCLVMIHAHDVHHELRHALFDLIKEPDFR